MMIRDSGYFSGTPCMYVLLCVLNEDQ